MRFKANDNFLDKLLTSPELAQALLPGGRAVLAEAKATAPRDSGEYEQSLEVWVDVTDRVAIRVGSRDVLYAARLNADTGHLARALDAVDRGA